MSEDTRDRDARRIEELSLNASGAFQSLLYDGWLLGFRAGPTKRLRCVNAFYSTSLPLDEKVDYCTRLYRSVGLPPIFRMLPFSQPQELDAHLGARGWVSFERTLVMRADIDPTSSPPATPGAVEIMDVPQWTEATAALLGVAGDALAAAVDRARLYPLPQAGAIVREHGDAVACGLLKREDDHVGLFALKTHPAQRRRGLGAAVVRAMLEEASCHGARSAYLQVTADNDAALALYRKFGFREAYHYWYRGLPGDVP